MVNCVIAYQALSGAQLQYTFRYLSEDYDGEEGPLSENCQDEQLCNESKARIFYDTWQDDPTTIRCFDAWTPESFGGDFCHPCLGTARMMHERGQEELWNILPNYFKLPQWAQLKQTQVAAHPA